ncbi:MAG: aspartyl protease family protein [Candidatus Desantisbacteria bacterium]
MGRIAASVVIKNTIEPEYHIMCDALVDTGASHMVLPSAWKNRLGNIETIEQIEVELANQTAQYGEICGPVKIQVEGFRPIYTEILFIDMKPENGIYEPLIGYIVLEQCQAGVDMLGHRLVHIKRMDLKTVQMGCFGQDKEVRR